MTRTPMASHAWRIVRVAAATLMVSLLAACRGPQSTLGAGGPAAARIATLTWWVVGTFVVVSVVMWVLIFWVAARRKGSLTTHEPVDAPEETRWILIGGFAIPVVILGVMFVATLRTMASFPMGGGEMDHRPADIRVWGRQWWWEVEYLGPHGSDHWLTANEIHIPVGRPVDIELQSKDVIHSFWVPKLHGKVDMIPDLVNRIRIQADAPGVYRGECAEYCGPQHAHMVLLVVAHPAGEYQAWLEAQQRRAVDPPDPLGAEGKRVFLTKQCVLCHSIRGTDARGRIGPDLTHVGSRLGIAANTAPNDVASLSAWVTHAQSIKPYARMPNITAMTGEETRALVTYLRELR